MTTDLILGLVGGMIIGLSVVLMMRLIGRIGGISGMVKSSLFDNDNNRLWRIMFIVGIVLGAALTGLAKPELMVQRVDYSKTLLIASGLLVGIGTYWSNGCTSGHGICGMARLSKRSIVATLTFIASAMVAVYITKHLVAL